MKDSWLGEGNQNFTNTRPGCVMSVAMHQGWIKDSELGEWNQNFQILTKTWEGCFMCVAMHQGWIKDS